MRLSRTAWLILGIGIFIIAFATLYTVYSRQSGEQEQLADSLAAAQARWPKVVSDREAAAAELTQWQNKLAEATSLLGKSEAKFPKSAESIEYDEILFDIADACDLEVMSLTASEPSDKKVKVEAEEITYIVTSFEVEVRGEVADILDFISEIARSEHFTSATVELVNIKVPEPAEGEEETELPTATIKLVGYSYKGE